MTADGVSAGNTRRKKSIFLLCLALFLLFCQQKKGEKMTDFKEVIHNNIATIRQIARDCRFLFEENNDHIAIDDSGNHIFYMDYPRCLMRESIIVNNRIILLSNFGLDSVEDSKSFIENLVAHNSSPEDKCSCMDRQ
jgi:hypothetical protein